MTQLEHTGFRLKVTLICCFITSAVAILTPLSANSALQGDINNDGRIDTSEAIFALQVTSGLYPGVSTSCLLSGRGNWDNDTDYVECDVVSSGGENYVCNTSHTSPISGEFGDDITNWDLLSLKGDPGDDAEKTTSFTDLTDQAADAQIPTIIARDSEITWNNLTDIPAGFADGADNDSGGDITGVTADSGLTGGGSSGGVTLSHSNTSSQASAYNSNGNVIQDISLDTYGHLTGMVTTNLDGRYYTETEANSNYVNASGDAMTGNLSTTANIGIGTADPSAGLHVKGSGYPNSFIFIEGRGVLDDSGIRLLSYGSTDWHIFNSATESDLLRIAPDDAYSSGGITIWQNGWVGIGTRAPGYLLHVNGSAYATGAYGSLSDRRHKENVSDLLFDALEIVKEMRPVTFQWKTPQDDGMVGDQLGFIAQEIEEVLPEVVFTQDNEEQTKGLKYSALIPVLTKAIQELEKKNEELKTLVCLDHPDASICQN